MSLSPRRATKIVATLGPASSEVGLLERMIQAGVNVVRLNFSHGSAQDHVDRAQMVREAAQRAGREVAIMADLQGPKIRVGKFAQGRIMLEAGASFVLDASRTELGDQEGVGLDYKELPRDTRPGDVLLLNDGLIVLTVEAVRGEAVHTKVRIGGELSNNKGINKQGGGLTAPALTAKDMEDIRTAMQFQADYVAVSFPKNATDMEMARQLCNVAAAEYRHKPGLIAKIERAEAIPHLESILRASDGIMVARGDLAVEVGNAAVPALQKKMIRMARDMDKVVITATQMMESMIDRTKPNRSEVSDVANAVLEGADAVMLSGETATGQYPALVVQTMSKIIMEVENNVYDYNRDDILAPQPHSPSFLSDAICYSACKLANDTHARALIGMTQSGYTAFMLSSYRPKAPLYIFSKERTLINQLGLSWGVRAFYYAEEESLDDIIFDQINILKERGFVKKDDVVINTGSTPINLHLPTNILKIIKVE